MTAQEKWLREKLAKKPLSEIIQQREIVRSSGNYPSNHPSDREYDRAIDLIILERKLEKL